MIYRVLHTLGFTLKGAIFATLFIGSLGHELGTASLMERFPTGKVDFSVQFKNEFNLYSVSAVFVLPDEIVRFEAQGLTTEKNFLFESKYGNLVESYPASWTWQAPSKPDLYPIIITEPIKNQTMTLNVFVMVPFKKAKNGMLNGYQIGSYPPVAKKNSVLYKHPDGFVEVTPQNRDTLVSPHFTLGQFLCKQSGTYPKYVVIRERLLYQLENVLAHVNEYGYRTQTLTIMSGYRTPSYNESIHNVPYSRHLWGDATDIFIDFDPKDGIMDDLNKDWKVDFQDSLVLKQLILNLLKDPMYQKFVGGLGVYKTSNHHGPFVHVDVRGVPAYW